MEFTLAQKLKVGDKVRWPQGANGCQESKGTVVMNEWENLIIVWDDGQQTLIRDSAAMQFVEMQ